ncbi:hypothetical protein [Lichenibacterium ramalinae]|nr:hypothetical protein [Lichenibacterium ramalinae]
MDEVSDTLALILDGTGHYRILRRAPPPAAPSREADPEILLFEAMIRRGR